MPFGLGLPEILIVLVLILVLFGPKRLPDLGRSLGTGMREFKDSVTGDKDKDKDRDELPERAAEPAPRPATEPAPREQKP
ncbi:MAG TPA: twin-arginine translocase TatA/TatE family subunit [Thermoleophilaceae bacterium]|jgi:sec-independent protein translocase protein TatA|nr:twin-arginine translocase TatA/TatE family subunit [Thermoleophilaceae bacterium]